MSVPDLSVVAGVCRAEALPTRPVKSHLEELPMAPVDWGRSLPSHQIPEVDLGSAERDEQSDDSSGEWVTERYENRAARIRRQVKLDLHRNYINHGDWTMWDRRGQVIAQGTFRNGKRHGSWMRVVSSGVAASSHFQGDSFQKPYVSQAEFVDGILHGTWTVIDAAQRPVASWEFKQGVVHGKVVAWYPNGSQSSDMGFQEGQPHGEAIYWAASGHISARHYYRDGRQLVPMIQRFDRQQKESEGWLLRSDFVYETTVDWWNDIVQIVRVPADGQDQKTGPWKEWHLNGNLRFAGAYEDGKPVGQHVWWYENGQKEQVGQFVDGKQHLAWTQWHDNGMKREEGAFAHGTKQGTWVQWDREGKAVDPRESLSEVRENRPTDISSDFAGQDIDVVLTLQPASTLDPPHDSAE